MKDIDIIIQNLANSPIILEGMISQIPAPALKNRRIEGKWSIHEHACHLVDVQQMLIHRFDAIRQQKLAKVEPYLPGKNIDDSYLIEMDLTDSLQKFKEYRAELIEIVAQVSNDQWNKEIQHPEYNYYTPYVLLRHILMHDHLHMYRIEELWLTEDSFLPTE